MKKTIRISIGGIAFNIEEDAFSLLENYIGSLKEHLGKSPESDEIVRDIEERAAELFAEKLGNSETITIDMVSAVIQTLGKPEQITNEESESASDTNDSTAAGGVKKRLYRDSDNAIIAGVCSGLSAYFRIDPLVFRILFAVLIFANGLGIIAYIILWIAVPKAETARQRLEMRGEEINFENLEKNIKKEFEGVRDNLNKQRASGLFERIFSAIGQIFVALGRVLGVVFKVIGIILAILLISVGLIGLLATVGSIFIGGFAVSSIFPHYTGLTLSEFLGTTFDMGSFLWVSIPVFLIIAIPLISIIYLGLRLVVRFRVRDTAFLVLLASVWIASVLALAFLVFLQARSFTIRESVKDKAELILLDPAFNTIAVKAMEFDGTKIIPEKPIVFDDYTVAIDDGVTSVIGKPRVQIGKASGDNFEMVIVKKSSGGTRNLAKASAQRVSMEYSLRDTLLTIHPYFFLPKGEKWRLQEVEITIGVPDGKQIYIHSSIESLLSSDQEYCNCWPDEMIGKTWVMRGQKLVEL